MLEQRMAENNLILKVLTGSHLYGTNTESSDKDYVGIFIPDKDYVMGLRRVEQVEIRTNPTSSGRRNDKDDTDTVLYSLPKFIHLAAQNNPNITEIFFAPQKNLVFVNDFGKRLMESYPLFISKKTKHTFLGYAFEQKRKLLTKNPIGSRAVYLEKYGYDVKFASHLIRLLSEGLQMLVEGRIDLPLPNNNYVRDIKLGKFSLEHVLADAMRYEELVEQAYITSPLPNTPNLEKLNELQISLLEDFWNKK